MANIVQGLHIKMQPSLGPAFILGSILGGPAFGGLYLMGLYAEDYP